MITFTNLHNLEEAVSRSREEYILVNLTGREVEMLPFAEHRLLQFAAMTGAPLVYSHYFEEIADGSAAKHPCIPYQPGSLRDDFDFGPVVALNCRKVQATLASMQAHRPMQEFDGGWYALRLALSLEGSITLLPEYLYKVKRTDFRKSGEKQHDYVNPRRRDYQQAMEKSAPCTLTVCTHWRRKLRGRLTPQLKNSQSKLR